MTEFIDLPAGIQQLLSTGSRPARDHQDGDRGLRLGARIRGSDRDVDFVMRAIRQTLGEWPVMEVNCQIQVLYSAFYRNKTAYIIGKAINGYQEYPFALAVRHSERAMLFVDTIHLRRMADIPAVLAIACLFPGGYGGALGLCAVPAQHHAEQAPCSELYTMLGLGKQGKTGFFRDLLAHLRHPTTSSSSRRASADW